MDSKTAFNFVNKLLEQTKNRKIKWESTRNAITHVHLFNSTYYYVATTRQGEILLGKNSYNNNEIHLYITPISNMVPGETYELSDFISWYDKENTLKYKECLKELFEYVYTSLPNPDSFIDSFLDE